MTDKEMEIVANKVVAKLAKCNLTMMKCPFDDKEERKKMHAFTEGSSIASAGYIGRLGRILCESSNKLASMVIISILLFFLGLFGYMTGVKIVASLLRGGD